MKVFLGLLCFFLCVAYLGLDKQYRELMYHYELVCERLKEKGDDLDGEL